MEKDFIFQFENTPAFYVCGCFGGYICIVFVCLWPGKPEEDIGAPGIGVTGSCEPSSRCWELHLGPLQERRVLLTPEPSLQPLEKDFHDANLFTHA